MPGGNPARTKGRADVRSTEGTDRSIRRTYHDHGGQVGAAAWDQADARGEHCRIERAHGAGTSVSVVDGANAVCTIVNDDGPVDLELTKTDSGFAAIAGSDPIPYTITVRNFDTRDADLGEPVTVTDELPAFLSLSAFPANRFASGRVHTCDIDPASMTAGGVALVSIRWSTSPATLRRLSRRIGRG